MDFFIQRQICVVDNLQQEGEFISHDTSKFYYQAWIPDNPKFLVLYLHGAASHSGEATLLAQHLSTIGGATYAFDQRGWGRSATRSAGHISTGEEIIQDVLVFLEFIKAKHSGLPVVLAGHSMGGLIASRILIDHQNEFICAVLSSPWIGTRIKIPFYVKLFGGLMAKIWPTFSDSLGVNMDELTHDNELTAKYYEEEEQRLRLNRGTVRWFDEMQKFQEHVKEEGYYIKLPILILQAGQDLIVSEAASKDLYNLISSEKKKWQYYPNLYHEVFNEVEEHRNDTLNEAGTFIDTYIKQITV